MPTLSSPGAYRRHADRRQEIIDEEIQEALGRALTGLIIAVRGLPDFPVDTGNLRNSVGVNQTISPSTSTLSHLPPSGDAVDVEDLVQKQGDRWVVFFTIGMSYAEEVLEPIGILDEPLRVALDGRHKASFRRHLKDAIDFATQRIEEGEAA